MKMIVVIALVIAVSVSVSIASEEHDAKELCNQVMTLYRAELAEKGISLSRDNTSCEYNARPPEYWSCVLGKMEANSSFVYASGACDSHAAVGGTHQSVRDARQMDDLSTGAAGIFGAAAQ